MSFQPRQPDLIAIGKSFADDREHTVHCVPCGAIAQLRAGSQTVGHLRLVHLVTSRRAAVPFRHFQMAHRPVPDIDYHEFPPAATPGSTSPHPFRRRRSAGQSAPQQVLYFRPDPQGQVSLRPIFRPKADGSLKSNPAGEARRPPVAFPDLPGFRPCGLLEHQRFHRRAIDDSAFCPREDGGTRLSSHRTLLSNPA